MLISLNCIYFSSFQNTVIDASRHSMQSLWSCVYPLVRLLSCLMLLSRVQTAPKKGRICKNVLDPDGRKFTERTRWYKKGSPVSVTLGDFKNFLVPPIFCFMSIHWIEQIHHIGITLHGMDFCIVILSAGQSMVYCSFDPVTILHNAVV